MINQFIIKFNQLKVMIMKKKKIGMICAISFLCMTASVYAQEKKHELEIGVGIFSFNEIADFMSEMIISGLPTGMKEVNGVSYGTEFIAYKYRVTDRLGLGGAFTFNYGTTDLVDVNRDKFGEALRNHYTLAAEADFRYLNTPLLKLYGLVGAGGTLYNLTYARDGQPDEKKSQPYFTFHVTPIGLKVGNNWGGFCELGFGYRGIVNAGLFVNL